MINVSDLYTWSQVTPMVPQGGTESIGTLIVEYEVHRCTDVRNLTTTRGYFVEVRQRVLIPNSGVNKMGQGQIKSYTYPVMFTAKIKLHPGTSLSQQPFYLVAATPKTIDSSVSMNVTASQADSTTASAQTTQGSSTSETSTWSANPILSALSGSPSTTTNFNEISNGTSTGASNTSGASDSMSIKEWSAYLSVDSSDQTPTWIFAQTFPWDPIKYHYTNDNSVVVPKDIRDLLHDSERDVIYPPSRIALFGLSFGMSARWLVLSDNSAPIDQLGIAHEVAPFTGSHGYLDSSMEFQLKLNTESVFAYPQTEELLLDLTQLALDPIAPGIVGNSTTVGFVLSQFVTKPSGIDGFCITSTGNTLLVRGRDFSDPVSSDAPMTANLKGAASASMSAFFKIIDEDSDYTLFLKHWVTTSTGAIMTIKVNETTLTPRHIDSLEAGSGTDNITRVLLRRKSYSSDEYFDYVVMGLNTITITISSEDHQSVNASDCIYAIRALAVT